MKLPETLLLTYKAEYEKNQTMTIAELCSKYDVQPQQLIGSNSWQKSGLQVSKPIDTKQTSSQRTTEETFSDIEEFKQLAIAHAIKFMKDDAEFAEVKEFKDMVAVVDSIEKSYKDKDTGTNINILVQNLTQKFRDTADDC